MAQQALCSPLLRFQLAPCQGCGGSCQGVTVRPLPEEIPRLREAAAALGVEVPFKEGTLRQVDGRCVFLTADNACRIHARYGAAAKPHVCQQFPLVVIHAEGGSRVGVDPSCFHAWQTWRTGPEPEEDRVLHGVSKERPDGEAQAEATLLGLLAAVPHPATALAQLSAPGIEQRWADLLRQQDHLPLLRLRQRPLVVVLLVVVQRAQMLVRQSGG